MRGKMQQAGGDAEKGRWMPGKLEIRMSGRVAHKAASIFLARNQTMQAYAAVR
jgi:hypothetical protein